MPSDQETTLADTVERLRAEKYPHLDKVMVREILRLHGDLAEPPNTLVAKVASEIRLHSGKAR